MLFQENNLFATNWTQLLQFNCGHYARMMRPDTGLKQIFALPKVWLDDLKSIRDFLLNGGVKTF